ncbi:MAG: hypothetical protein EB832_00620 [Thaumarchaeota archaeon S14]|nr:MAG: hypothetical protein EB832_00620 [Thaumarchaeota archaeon S14]
MGEGGGAAERPPRGGAAAGKITDEDRERVSLLSTVASDGLDALTMDQLERLQELVEKRPYEGKKAKKSKMRLLARINVAIYELAEGRRGI